MRLLQIVLAGMAFTSALEAQQKSADTTKTYKIEEVVVTATRSPISIMDSPSPIEAIDLQKVESANGTTVADVLQSYSSIFLKNYGASAALKTSSLRGTASEHLLVLLNGNRLNSFQNGLVDFSLLLLNDVERIEILHSGSSALYGADALGGVINIFTRRATERFRSRAEIGAGSFGYGRYLLESGGRIGQAGILLGYSSDRGRDDYPFALDRGGLETTTTRRTNSDFQRRQLYLHGDVATDERSVVTYSAQYVFADRGVSGSVLFPTDLARQNDKDVNVNVNYHDTRIDRVQITLKGAFHYNLQKYADPTYFIDSYYKNLFFNVNPHVQVSMSSSHRLLVGGEWGRGLLYGNDFDGRIERTQKSLYVSNELQFDSQRSSFDRVSLYQTVRYDDISDVDHAVTPKVGLNVRILKRGDLRLRASFGRNFRAPSFNDMYYRGFSNPHLKPEHSTTFDIGGLAAFRFYGDHAIELTYFRLTTRDRIVFDPTTFLPVNIGRARSTGIEARYEGRFFEGLLSLGVNYTLSSARKADRSSDSDPTFEKQLLYIPREVANVSFSVRLEPLTLNVTHSVTGRRYTREDNSDWLSPYGLSNCNLLFKAPFEGRRLFLKAELNNVLDKDYEVFPYYPMPRRNFRITVGVES